MKTGRTILLPGMIVVLAAGICLAQNWGGRRSWGGGGGYRMGPIIRTEGGNVVNEDTVRTARETVEHSTETPNWTNALGFEKDVFTYARIIYKMNDLPAPVELGWVNDYPDSDLNLSFRLQQLTSMKVDPNGRVLKLTSPDLFDYPWIFMAQPGHMELRDEEVPILRKYLLNGGVLMVDDFWGDAEWQSFETEMKRVLPERHWVELPMDHPIFHCVFDLKMAKNDLQVQTKNFWRRGGITHRGRTDTADFHVRAWLDDKQRIMVIALHNTDTGDGWEREGENIDYFQTFSESRAYPLGINIIFYLMTH
jgi:hypothetical protein